MKAERNYESAPLIVLGMNLARIAPRRLGQWSVRQGARLLRRSGHRAYHVLRENLAHVVSGLTPEELDRLTVRALCELGYTYIDMFHIRQEDLQQGKVLSCDPQEWDMARAQFRDPHGTVIAGGHVGNFDLAAQWIASQGEELQALTIADPGRGTQAVNRYREQERLVVTPISVQALREAIRRLRSGGVVATGVDRPVSYDDAPVLFFDAPAPLPTGHVRMALQTGARVMVAACLRQPDGTYRLHFQPPIDIIHTGDRDTDVGLNTRRVLELVEGSIRGDPAQWGMLHPVWRRPHAPDPHG